MCCHSLLACVSQITERETPVQMRCNQLVVILDIDIWSFVHACTSCTESSYRVSFSSSLFTQRLCPSRPDHSAALRQWSFVVVPASVWLSIKYADCLSLMSIRALESQLLKHVTDSVQPHRQRRRLPTQHT